MDFKALGENLGLEEDEFKELVELFVLTGKADHEKLRDAIDGNDLDQARLAAHTLAGAAGNLGLMDLHASAKQIELDVLDNRLDRLSEAAQSVKLQIDAIAAIMDT